MCDSLGTEFDARYEPNRNGANRDKDNEAQSQQNQLASSRATRCRGGHRVPCRRKCSATSRANFAWSKGFTIRGSIRNSFPPPHRFCDFNITPRAALQNSLGADVVCTAYEGIVCLQQT